MNRSLAVLLIAIPAARRLRRAAGKTGVGAGGRRSAGCGPARPRPGAGRARRRGFKANCAACHGAHAEGARNWHRPGPDGKYPPPLNGSAHDWHHPMGALKQTIREGTAKLGGSMPAWKDKLSDADIEAVIAWFQSRWPEEVYKSWALMDEKARRGLVRH